MDWLIPPEQVRDAFSRVPKPLREFIAEGELADITKRIAAEHSLHVDTAGTLSQLLTIVLLGFLDPSVLPRELERIGIPSEKIPEFIKELNSQIFIPLQKKVREAGHEPSKEERILEDAEANDVRPASFRTETPSPTVLPPKIEVSDAPAPPKPDVTPSYNLIQQNAPAQGLATPTQREPQPATTTAPPVQIMRTMQHDMDLVQHGSLPASYSAASTLPHPSQATPARMFQTASVPVTSAPSQSRPSTVHILPDSRPQLPQPAQIAPVKGSAADPYREPI